MVAMMATWKDSAKRSRISSQMGEPVHMDVPKSSRAAPPIHVTNWRQMGWSRPKRARSDCSASGETEPRSPASRSSTTSPGMTRMRKNVKIATPSKVGNIRTKRLRR